jgi:putative ABC transport system substrate-binding protein
MRRREFITLLAGAAASWPRTAMAQQSGIPTVGFLGTGSSSGWHPWIASFVQRLNELGWIEGRTITIEYRWGEGRRERFAEIAGEFVRLKVNVIVTGGSAVSALKQATSVIPIVFILATDPIGGGLIASLSRPGENVTGSSNLGVDLAAKRLELLREAVPTLRRLAVLANAGYPDSLLEMNEVQSTAERLGLEVTRLEIWQAKDIAPAFETLKEHHDSLYVVVDGLIAANRKRVSTPKRGRLCLMGQTSTTCSVAPPSTWIGYCAERIQLSCQSSSRPNSIWSSIS